MNPGSVATITGGTLALFIIAAALVNLRKKGATPGAAGRMLRLLAFAVTVAMVVALSPFTIADSGTAAIYLLGVPVVAAVGPLVADRARRAVGITTTVAALVMLTWGLILGLGIGLWFVVPALLLAMAAVATASSRHASVSNTHDA
jgi:hypothetical protein